MLTGLPGATALFVVLSTSSGSWTACSDEIDKQETIAFSVKDYGVEVRVPPRWKLVAKADEAMVFGFTIPTEAAEAEAGVKCEIAPAPETLDDYRTRIDRRAERQRVPGVSLKRNTIVQTDAGEWLETEWNYDPG